MKSFFKFLAVFLTILVLSILLAPLLFKFLPFKFERIFNRLIMIFTMVAVILFVRVRRETFRRYGLVWQAGDGSVLVKTFLAGFLILAALAGLRVVMGSARWSPASLTWMGWALKTGELLGTAFLIGIIEEFFFRGFVFQTLYKRFSWNLVVSILLTSVFYSLIHFISEKNPYIGPHPTWRDSLILVSAPFQSLREWPHFWPAAVGLFLFGLILNDLAVRMKSLYASIGLHAGCVFFIKMDGSAIDFLSENAVWTGGSEIYSGVLGWVFLLALWAILRIMLKSRRERS